PPRKRGSRDKRRKSRPWIPAFAGMTLGEDTMACRLRRWMSVTSLVFLLLPALARAQQRGGVLQIAHRDSPASMSTLDELTISTVAPMMAVFSNLVLFDQHVPQNTLQSI